MNKLEQSIRQQISDTLGDAGIKHNQNDIEQIISITNLFKDSGRKISYGKVAEFIASDENKDIIEQVGLEMVLKSMPYMKLGTITGRKKIGRNDLCFCGSGKKYKNCCINEN